MRNLLLRIGILFFILGGLELKVNWFSSDKRHIQYVHNNFDYKYSRTTPTAYMYTYAKNKRVKATRKEKRMGIRK